MEFSDEFKEALSLLPDKKKDQLLLRLLKKDTKLARKLYFELVDTEPVIEKREEIREQIAQVMEHYSSGKVYHHDMYHSLRNLSGLIRDHVDVTKDKFGEIVLNAFMLRKCLDETNEQLKRYDRWTAYKLYTYIIARAYKILLLLSKTHVDLHMDVYDDIVALGNHIQENEHLLTHATTCSFDVNWMIDFEIPDNIHEIYKEVSAKGYLR